MITLLTIILCIGLAIAFLPTIWNLFKLLIKLLFVPFAILGGCIEAIVGIACFVGLIYFLDWFIGLFY